MQIEIFLDYGFYLEKNYSFPKLQNLLINIINLKDNENNKSLKEPVDYFLCNSTKSNKKISFRFF
jgi:hypothetical protein